MKILIINGHHKYDGIAEGGIANKYIEVASEISKLKDIEIMYSNIQDFEIEDEIEKMLSADYIMFHAPIYWFGLPWQTKKYIDEVFNVGLFERKLLENDGRSRNNPTKQYGTGGKIMAKFFMTTSMNAPKDAFEDESQFLFGNHNLNELLMPITSVFKFSGATILDAFASYDVMKNPDVENDIIEFRKYLNDILED